MELEHSSVYKLLSDKGIAFKLSGNDYLIKCLNPDHEDSNPSCRVDTNTGIAHCFACGWKANMFRYFGVLTSQISQKTVKLKQKLKEMQEAAVPVPQQLPGATLVTKSFRGISVETLNKFEAFTTNNEKDLEGRIVFPIRNVGGEVAVYHGRHMFSDEQPKYKNFPRKVQLFPFPIVIDRTKDYIVLVEGMFDMLNLYDKGLHNVVCAFGTSSLLNFKDPKTLGNKLLPYKTQGVTRIFVAFDPDEAGKKAGHTLVEHIKQLGYYSEFIDLPDDRDPGELTQYQVNTLIRAIER